MFVLNHDLYFLHTGADPTLKDDSGHSPIEYAGKESIKALIKEHSAQVAVHSKSK